jgi:hypothetical protein
VDHNRDPLDDKVLYHTRCGEFYNYATIRTKYNVTGGMITEDLVDVLKGQLCVNCSEGFSHDTLRICYTQSAKLDSPQQQFETLGTFSMYTQDT